MEKLSPIGWAHGYLSAKFYKYFIYVNRKRESTRKGKRRGAELTLCFRIDIYGAWALGNPMPELTLTHFLADFNSCKRTKNLDPEDKSIEKHGVWDPMPELTITSPDVHSRADSNTFTMGLGNPMPESTLPLYQSRLYP